MQNVRNPWWLLVINTLPVVLLAMIYYGSFDTIHSLLSPESIRIWKIFSIALGVLWLTHLSYAIILILRKRSVGGIYGLLSLCVYSAFLYIYYVYSDIAIPVNIPGWMMPEDITLFVGTFIMPTLAHALLVLVVVFTKSTNGKRAWISFGVAFIIPVAWYLFFQVILPLWQDVSYSRYHEHILIVFLLTGTAVFLFFVMRGIYIVSSQRGRLWQQYSFVWRVMFGLVFPLVGLLFNEMEYDGIFGNFSDRWFYILAALNGIAITLPQFENKRLMMVIFFVRSITIVYIFYFFVVFLPYLPLSVIAIIAVGAGFLMLTPLVLMVLQLRIMSDDISFLRKRYSNRVVYGTMIAGLLILPTIITSDYILDKATLTRALNYAYTPDLDNESPINIKALNRVLHTVERGKERSWGRNREGATPYLSTYYTWLVLDNLTLSDQKINTLDRIFNGTPLDSLTVDSPFTALGSEHIELQDIHTSSVYDEQQHAWKSTVELKIRNNSGWQAEYATSFELPAGSWISEYYLWIGKDKVPGILAEKKTATWVYQQIVNYRRDPGILYYLTGNRIALRVFPLEANEVRRTGFEILHKEPATLTIGERQIDIGDAQLDVSANFESFGSATYVSAKAKERLPKVKRPVQYHFVLDCSVDNRAAGERYIDQVEKFAAENHVDVNSFSFTLCNAYANQMSSWDETKKRLAEDIFSGGFFLERAIQKIATKNFLDHSDKQPVIVIVSNNFSKAIIRKDFADLKTAFPESDIFFELSDAKLIPHSLISSPMDAAKTQTTYDVVEWKTEEGKKIFLRLDDQPSVFFDSARRDENVTLDHSWNSALALQGRWFEQQFYPEKSKSEWLSLVRSSFQAQIMSPVTSFISVENEAQKKALLKKQEDVLKANPSLDIGEEVRMSEPGSWIVVIMLMFICYRYRQILFNKYTTLIQLTYGTRNTSRSKSV
jgi:hypothetical protein